MKRLISIIGMISAIAFSHSALSQCKTPEPFDKKGAIGKWKGSYSSKGGLLLFSLEISEDQGDLVATVDIPNTALDFKVKVCKSQELHIKGKNGASTIEFIGKPKYGETMSGRILLSENGNLVSQEVFAVKHESFLASN